MTAVSFAPPPSSRLSFLGARTALLSLVVLPMVHPEMFASVVKETIE